MMHILAHRSTTVHLLLLMFFSIALWIPRFRGPIDLRYDAGVYYILGTSLEQGKGYRLLNEPSEIQAIQYPPFLPLFAAMHQRLAGTGDPAVAGHWLRISFFVIFLGFVIATYRLSKNFLTSRVAFLATAVVLLHVHTTWMSELFFAELPFALTSVLFLLIALRGKNRSRDWLVGLLGAVSFLLRSAGIALFIAWIGESLFKRRLKEMAFRAALTLIPVLAWQGYIAHVKIGQEYLQTSYEYQRAGYQFYNVGYLENLMYVDPFVPELGTVSFKALVKRITLNLIRMPVAIGGAMSVDPERVISRFKRVNQQPERLKMSLWVAQVALALLGAAVLFGLMLLLHRGEWLIFLYITCSAFLICLVPWPAQFIRYLWPIAPVLAIAFFTALVTVRDYLSRVAGGRWRIPVSAVVATVVICVSAMELFALGKSYQLSATAAYKTVAGHQREYRLFFYTPAWQLHDTALDWLKSEANSDEIVATSTPHWVYLKCGLRAVMPPFENDVSAAQRLIDSVPVNYLILDNLEFVDITRRYGARIVQAFPECWELIYSTGKIGSKIYRRVNPDIRLIKHQIPNS